MAQEREIEARFLLYIDILNFSSLVAQEGKVEELYEIVDSLNVHRHDAFTTIVFSDTILVYNKVLPAGPEDDRYIVMYLCEFAPDLFYRLVGRDVHFRAYITHGDFAHYSTENIRDVFYGTALIEAYRAENGLRCMGLFMSNAVVRYSSIFGTARFKGNCHFVYLMQSLLRWSFREQDYPLDPALLVDTDEVWFLAYDIRYLGTIYRHKNDPALGPRVRGKYESTWRMLRKKHGGFMSVLEKHNFDPRAICACDWSEPLRRVGTPRGFFG